MGKVDSNVLTPRPKSWAYSLTQGKFRVEAKPEQKVCGCDLPWALLQPLQLGMVFDWVVNTGVGNPRQHANMGWQTTFA